MRRASILGLTTGLALETKPLTTSSENDMASENVKGAGDDFSRQMYDRPLCVQALTKN
jgi:hypothetical protein